MISLRPALSRPLFVLSHQRSGSTRRRQAVTPLYATCIRLEGCAHSSLSCIRPSIGCLPGWAPIPNLRWSSHVIALEGSTSESLPHVRVMWSLLSDALVLTVSGPAQRSQHASQVHSTPIRDERLFDLIYTMTGTSDREGPFLGSSSCTHPDRPGPAINEHAHEKNPIYIYPCGHRMAFSYLTLMVRAPSPPCVRHAPCPLVCVPPPSHYHRMEYHISAAAYSRPRGHWQMSSTRRRKSSLAADGLDVNSRNFFLVRTARGYKVKKKK
jgi:hypothetical protein